MVCAGIAGQTVVGSIAGQTVIGTALAGEGALVGEGPGQTGRVADAVSSEVKVREALGAGGRVGAHLTVGEAPGTDSGYGVKVARKRVAPLAGGIELSEVQGGATQAVAGGVAGQAVVGTGRAPGRLRVPVKALGAAGIAEVVAPHEVAPVAGSAEGRRVAAEAAGRAGRAHSCLLVGEEAQRAEGVAKVVAAEVVARNTGRAEA